MNSLLGEKFRKNIYSVYDLDPVNFVTVPWYSWMAALKKTEIELELLTDVDILHVHENLT